jgi:pSer/pThr/pTyr-binding forkhead associated (FHA) protein
VAPPAAPAVHAAPAPAAPHLYVLSGPRTGQRIPLHNGFTIGKAPGSHLLLDQDGFASSAHAAITMDARGTCTLVDRGSTNGTFVNGIRVTQVVLTHGMAVRVGSTELRFLTQ